MSPVNLGFSAEEIIKVLSSRTVLAGESVNVFLNIYQPSASSLLAKQKSALLTELESNPGKIKDLLKVPEHNKRIIEAMATVAATDQSPEIQTQAAKTLKVITEKRFDLKRIAINSCYLAMAKNSAHELAACAVVEGIFREKGPAANPADVKVLTHAALNNTYNSSAVNAVVAILRHTRREQKKTFVEGGYQVLSHLLTPPKDLADRRFEYSRHRERALEIGEKLKVASGVSAPDLVVEFAKKARGYAYYFQAADRFLMAHVADALKSHNPLLSVGNGRIDRPQATRPQPRPMHVLVPTVPSPNHA